MFSRAWLAILAGSFALWGMSQLGGGPSPTGPGEGGAVSVSPAAASDAVPALAACLEDAASPDPDSREVLPVQRRYRRWCLPLLGGDAFDAFAVVYGERSRAVVSGIVSREARLAVEVAAGPQGTGLDPDVVWAAALVRAASDLRDFERDLSAWFDARVPVGDDGVAARRQ